MAGVQADSPYKGSGALTKEQFLFYEMRTTAKLMDRGLSDKEIMTRAIRENLFQYPTEKSVRSICRSCLARLKALNDADLVNAVAVQPSETAKQICLYAMMKQYRLVWDFMITVIGEKYRTQDLKFSRSEIGVFFMRLQEQDDCVAGWSESTIKKITSVFISVLVENGYLDNRRSDHLNPVLLERILENGIQGNNDAAALPAFNYFA